MRAASTRAAMEVWGGVECTVNRVGDRWFDQTRWSGHEDRLADLDRFASLGLHALRYPIVWERAAPASLDTPDFTWCDARLARIRALGMRPIVGLVHHGSGPSYTSLVDPHFPALLARYARLVAERYPWVVDYTPVNEPLTTARFSGLYGLWYPHSRDSSSFVRALLAQLRGTVLAMQAIRSVNPAARLVQTEDCGVTSGTRPTRRQVAHERDRRWLTFDLLTGCVDRDHPMHEFLLRHGASEQELAFFREHPCPPEIVGLNYYLTSDRFLDHRLERYPPHQHGGNGQLRYADVEAVRTCPDGIAGHEAHLTEAWRRYQLPVAITEVHLSCTRDEQVRWLVESWQAAHRARGAGVDVRAVTAWALLGSFDWDTLVTREQRHYEPGVFDVRSSPPRATRLATIVHDMAQGRAVDHPVLDGTPWWRHPRRLLGGPGSAAAQHRVDARPLLLTGAGGTLGRAFHRICAERGLATSVFTRHDLDVTQVARVDAALRTVRPWAVINAAGFVRVDDAEQDREACRQVNADGAANLAAACQRHQIPLVTFSSDLVFDGLAARPYVESDSPCPLNVYGSSKASSERRVLAICHDALVVRTSAFFGAWDEENYAMHVVRALAEGRTFYAAADYVVSPTYVPDLVHAVLDLLIDGESGVWHLANDGALTWYAFAQAVAVAVGLPAALVEPATQAAHGRAARPTQSALASARGAMMRPLPDAIAAFAHELSTAAYLRPPTACATR